MSDRIAVCTGPDRAGRRAPRGLRASGDGFVAGFVGTSNLLERGSGRPDHGPARRRSPAGRRRARGRRRRSVATGHIRDVVYLGLPPATSSRSRPAPSSSSPGRTWRPPRRRRLTAGKASPASPGTPPSVHDPTGARRELRARRRSYAHTFPVRDMAVSALIERPVRARPRRSGRRRTTAPATTAAPAARPRRCRQRRRRPPAAADLDRPRRGRARHVGLGEATLQPQWVHPFEQATGCKVNAKPGGTSDQMVTLMRQGGGTVYDGVSASGDASNRLIANGDVAPVNVDLIPD